MTRIWRAVLVAVAIPVAGGALLVGEAMVASRGERPADPPAGLHDVLLGPVGDSPPVAVWLGDSTAAGVGASAASTTLPEQVAILLRRPVRLTVLAHSGDRVSDVLRSQLPRVAALRPSAVFISVGANDVTHLTSRGTFRREYGRMLAGLPSTVTEIVVLGVPDMGAPPRLAQPLRAVTGWRGRSLDAEVRRIARLHRAHYVNIAAATGPTFRRHPRRYFARDGYHPDDAGYGLWAQAVAAASTTWQLPGP